MEGPSCAAQPVLTSCSTETMNTFIVPKRSDRLVQHQPWPKLTLPVQSMHLCHLKKTTDFITKTLGKPKAHHQCNNIINKCHMLMGNSIFSHHFNEMQQKHLQQASLLTNSKLFYLFRDFIQHLYKYVTVQVHRNSCALFQEWTIHNINSKKENFEIIRNFY